MLAIITISLLPMGVEFMTIGAPSVLVIRLYKARTQTTELCRERHNCSWATSRGFKARLWLWLWLWLEVLSKLRDLEQTT